MAVALSVFSESILRIASFDGWSYFGMGDCGEGFPSLAELRLVKGEESLGQRHGKPPEESFQTMR